MHWSTEESGTAELKLKLSVRVRLAPYFKRKNMGQNQIISKVDEIRTNVYNIRVRRDDRGASEEYIITIDFNDLDGGFYIWIMKGNVFENIEEAVLLALGKKIKVQSQGNGNGRGGFNFVMAEE